MGELESREPLALSACSLLPACLTCSPVVAFSPHCWLLLPVNAMSCRVTDVMQGKKPVEGNVVDTAGANWQDWLPVPVPLYTVPPVPSGHGAMINPTVLAQLQQRKA